MTEKHFEALATAVQEALGAGMPLKYADMPKRKPRHILTPEERARGHKLTREDCVKGAIAANRIRGAWGGKVAQAKGTAHKLSVEERRRGGLVTAAKRREARARALVTLALPAKRDLEPLSTGWTPGTAGPDNLPVEISPALPVPMSPAVARAFGASLVGKLFTDVPPLTSEAIRAAGDAALAAHGRESADLSIPQVVVDAFTLSALRRFRLGPVTPFQLTRSQRAQVDLMREAGYIEVTSDSMLQLTSKGREAIENAS